MISKRIISFVLLLVSFGLLTYASPVNDGAIAARSLLKDAPADLVEHLERRGGFPHKPCRCPDDLKNTLGSCKDSLQNPIKKLDGHQSPKEICAEIIEKIKVTITLVEKITIDGCSVTIVIQECISIIIEIIVSVCQGLHKYSHETIVVIIQEIINIHITLVQTCCSCCPVLFEEIKIKIQVYIQVVSILPGFCDYLGLKH